MSTETQRWEVGDVTITSIVEEQTDHIPPEFFFPAATAANVAAHDWVMPTWADTAGNIGLRTQALVIETPTRRIVVDPCVGNGKTLTLPFWNDGSWPFLERFESAGFSPEAIDLVLHTHLHEDHVGWDTRLVDGTWRPTFPRARHLFVREGWQAFRESVDPVAPHVWAETLQPLDDAGLVDLIDVAGGPDGPGLDLGEGLRLVSTPGHMAGHVSLWLEQPGTDPVLVTGDFVHHPVQLAEPDWAEIADIDAALAATTRRAMFAEAAERSALVIGTHFPTAPAGRIEPDGDVWRFTV